MKKIRHFLQTERWQCGRAILHSITEVKHDWAKLALGWGAFQFYHKLGTNQAHFSQFDPAPKPIQPVLVRKLVRCEDRGLHQKNA